MSYIVIYLLYIWPIVLCRCHPLLCKTTNHNHDSTIWISTVVEESKLQESPYLEAFSKIKWMRKIRSCSHVYGRCNFRISDHRPGETFARYATVRQIRSCSHDVGLSPDAKIRQLNIMEYLCSALSMYLLTGALCAGL